MYGQLPAIIREGIYPDDRDKKEFLSYQYLPIKLAGQYDCVMEERLHGFWLIIDAALNDFFAFRGHKEYVESFFVYATIKRRFVSPDCPMNREGYHSDGFGTEDINYVWCDKFPTIYNYTPFRLSSDEYLSMQQMEIQADKYKEQKYKENSLLRLNQYCIHKVAPITYSTVRTFVKISFSRDKYNLLGNSHNYLLDYKWNMKPRKLDRNIPCQ